MSVQYIRIEASNININFYELEVYDSNDINVARNSSVVVTQSSMHHKTSLGNLNDGVITFNHGGNTSDTNYLLQMTHTLATSDEWIEINLGATYNIKKIRLYHRPDSYRSRIYNLPIYVQNSNKTTLQTFTISSSPIHGNYNNISTYYEDFVVDIPSLISSNICFYGNAKVLTDEGYKEIRKVKKGDLIKGEKVKEVTRTTTEEKDIVLMKASSLMNNMPLEDTRITKEHKVLYKGHMVEAKELVNGSNIVYEKYKGDILYNLLMSRESKMVVNGMIVETLSPSNNIAKLYQIMEKYDNNKKNEIIRIYNQEKQKSNSKSI